MSVTMDQAKEAKEELKPILRAMFNGKAAQVGLGSRPGSGGGRDFGVAVRLQWTPSEQEKSALPLSHTTKSNVIVSIQYDFPGNARAL